MRIILGVIAILVLLVLGGIVWVYSGNYDVAVQKAPHPVVGWLLDTAKRQSVRGHARGIKVPPLGDPEAVEQGARLFARDCVMCHGAPGAAAQPFAHAMRPAARELGPAVPSWTSAELFWMVRNGLRRSGMPAWGDIYADGELWSVVAFLTQLPTMDAARFQSLTAPPPEESPPAAETGTDVMPPAEGEETAPAPEEAPATPGEAPAEEAPPAPPGEQPQAPAPPPAGQ